MKEKIKFLNQKKFIGKRLSISFTDNKTFELWYSFMPRRNEIENVNGNELYSIEAYPESYFESFNPDKVFDKWAAVEVSDYSNIPEGMDYLIIPAGLYAVFIHKGLASEEPKTYENIFRKWLPASGYRLDNRPHFGVMGEKYQIDSPASEEEIWIPVKPK